MWALWERKRLLLDIETTTSEEVLQRGNGSCQSTYWSAWLWDICSEVENLLRCWNSLFTLKLTDSPWNFKRPLPKYCRSPQAFCPPPQWGAADAEMKVPSGENTELKRSPFKAWSRSVYSLTCYAYCQGFLPCLFLPFGSIYLRFFFF